MTDKEKREIQIMVDSGNSRVIETLEAKFDSQIGEFMRNVKKRFETLEQPQKGEDKLLSTADALLFFQITRSTLNRYVKAGLQQHKPPGEKRGRAFYKQSDLNNFLLAKG